MASIRRPRLRPPRPPPVDDDCSHGRSRRGEVVVQKSFTSKCFWTSDPKSRRLMSFLCIYVYTHCPLEAVFWLADGWKFVGAVLDSRTLKNPPNHSSFSIYLFVCLFGFSFISCPPPRTTVIGRSGVGGAQSPVGPRLSGDVYISLAGRELLFPRLPRPN